jgi:hypothetical protein
VSVQWEPGFSRRAVRYPLFRAFLLGATLLGLAIAGVIWLLSGVTMP